MLIVLLSCKTPATDSATPADTQVDSSVPDTESPTGDSGGDSASAWSTLPDVCAAPSELADDPITKVGGVLKTQDTGGGFFVELIDLELDGDVAYAVGQGGLMSYDISEPTEPALLHHLAGPQSRFHRVELLGDGWVAVTHRDFGFYTVDVRDPSDQVLVHEQATYGWEGLALDGDHLYVTDREEGVVHVLDVSSPSSPTEVGTSEEGLSTPWDLTPVADGWTYAADNDLGLVPIQVDGASVTIGTPVAFDGATLHAALDGDHLYVSLGSRGVAVLDRSDPAAPVEIARLDIGGSAVMASAADGWLWVVDHEGVSAWDVSDPSDPVIRGYEVTEQFALAVRAAGTRAWVGDWNWFVGYDVDPDAVAGELDAASDTLTVPEDGGEVDLDVTNRGSGTLNLLGARSVDSRISVLAETDTLEPGETTTLKVLYEGGGELDATLCLSSDDPDGPTQEIELHAGDEDYGLGAYAPDFSITDIDGNSFTLSDHLGDPIFIAFWASW